MIWFKFFISAVVIIVSGIRLTSHVDQLSDQLQLGKVWMGAVLLGFVTSLPEVITSLASVISFGSGDLAVGNVLGSNNFNPMLLVVMDAAYRQDSVTNAIRPHASHTASACFAAFLTVGVIAGIFFKIGLLVSLLIALGYFGGMRYLGLLEKKEENKNNTISQEKKESLFRIYLNIVVSSLCVIGAAIFLAGSADALAEETGLGRTFVGSIFLALVTSLPEMVVSLSALKLGAFDLAVGNIFGSNMTNIFIVPICEVFYQGGSILNEVSSTHILTASLSILLTLVAMIGIHCKNKKTFFGMGLDSFIMVLLFIAGTKILYNLK